MLTEQVKTLLYIFFLQLLKCSIVLKNISLGCDNEDIIITYHCIATNNLTLQQTLLEHLLQYIITNLKNILLLSSFIFTGLNMFFV